MMSLRLALCVLALSAVVTALAGPPPLPSPDAEARRVMHRQPVPVPNRVPTSRVFARLEPGTDPAEFALAYGVAYVSTMPGDRDGHVFEAGSIAGADRVVARARLDRSIREVFRDDIVRPIKTAYPDDPLYPPTTEGALSFPGCWHLNGASGFANVRADVVWQAGFRGQGVVVTIVDDGVQANHPDFAGGFSPANSWNYGNGQSDPSPTDAGSNHGTAVAGVAAARGNNTLGTIGAAPEAWLGGITFGTAGPASQYTDAILFRSSGPVANRGIDIKNYSFHWGYGTVTSSDAQAIGTSSQAGTIHVWSAGNDVQDSNWLMNQASPWSITVAALGSNSVFSDYTSFGANVTCTAPSSSTGQLSITTTDRTGASGYNTNGNTGGFYADLDYNNTFGGTSSSAPLVAGVLALARGANPNADSRLMKHILARTATKVDPTQSSYVGGWSTNAAGVNFSAYYGFGAIDAVETVESAYMVYGSTPLVTWSSGVRAVGAPVTDASQTAVTRQLTVPQSFPLEEVVLRVQATHTRGGDLEVFLASPAGTLRRVVLAQGAITGNVDREFTVHGFWGENPQGTWTVYVRDMVSGETGTWDSYTLTCRMGGYTSRQGSAITIFNPTTRALGGYQLLSNRIFAWQGLPQIGAGWQPVAVKDINNDYTSDVLQWNPTTRQVGYWVMKQKLIRTWRSLGTLAPNWRPVGISDINDDNEPDIMLYNTSTRSLAAWLCTNGVVSGWRTVTTLGAGREVRGFADIEGDGDDDILIDIPASRIFGFFEMNGPTIVNWRGYGNYSAGWSVVGAGDFDVDGNGEALLYNATTRDYGAWRTVSKMKGAWSSFGKGPTGWNTLGMFPL